MRVLKKELELNRDEQREEVETKKKTTEEKLIHAKAALEAISKEHCRCSWMARTALEEIE